MVQAPVVSGALMEKVEKSSLAPSSVNITHHIMSACDLIMHTSELVFLSDQEQESPPPT